MTSEDLRSELDKQPFGAFRIYLVSGKHLDIKMPGVAFMLQNAVLVLKPRTRVGRSGYDVIALRNIERIERFDQEEVHP